jgi:deazaflavin-dependent oxidoreductase (nitroreductase family)
MAATRPGMGAFYLFVRLVDLPISHLTKGVFIPSANWNIMPIIYLTTTGTKSGIPRSSPVPCIPDRENLILVGSNWGNPKNPGRAYNLRTHSQTQVRRGKMAKGFTARELHGDERAATWQKAVMFISRMFPTSSMRAVRCPFSCWSHKWQSNIFSCIRRRPRRREQLLLPDPDDPVEVLEYYMESRGLSLASD